MYQHDDPSDLQPVRSDIPPEIRSYVIQLLQQTLACTVDLRSQVKQACWNVTGDTVVPLQALFATMATDLDAYTDLVAERLVVLGGVARGTARTASRQSTLPEYPGAILEGHGHVRALAERFVSYATALRDDIARAAEVEDAGSAAIYTDLSRGVDKQLWVLDAHLHPSKGHTSPPSVAVAEGQRAGGTPSPGYNGKRGGEDGRTMRLPQE